MTSWKRRFTLIAAIVLLAGHLQGCLPYTFRGETIDTGNLLFRGDKISCDRWEAGEITYCTRYDTSAVVHRGLFLLVRDIDDETGGYDKSPVRLPLNRHSGVELHVDSKDVYLLAVDVLRYRDNTRSGFAKMTEHCKQFLLANPLTRLVDFVATASDAESVNKRFASYFESLEVATEVKAPHLINFNTDNDSGGVWFEVSWTDGHSVYQGQLIGDCWGSFNASSR